MFYRICKKILNANLRFGKVIKNSIKNFQQTGSVEVDLIINHVV